MGTQKYSERTQEDEKVLQEVEIKALEKTIADLPADKRKEPRLVVADRTLSFEQLLDEVKKGTAIGRNYLEARKKTRREQLRRK